MTPAPQGEKNIPEVEVIDKLLQEKLHGKKKTSVRMWSDLKGERTSEGTNQVTSLEGMYVCFLCKQISMCVTAARWLGFS